MLTGELRGKIDRVWDAFWSGGIANPLEVIEQITYLLFIRGLDDVQTREENKANRLKQPMARRVFPEGDDTRGLPYERMRWSSLRNLAPAEMFTTVAEHVFPFIREMGGADTAHGAHMKGAPLHRPDARPARQGGRPPGRHSDGGSRHQGRPLRIHARQDR